MKRILLPLLLVLFVSPPAFAAKRVALVIGNADYTIGQLKNPVNDAIDIAAKLRKLGFDVTLLRNADQRTMERQIGTFRNQLSGADIRLFYYAGYGMQVNGINYLIPVNIDVQFEDDIKYEAVDAGRVLDSMAAAGKGASIVILDACRNNPFKHSFRSTSSGLARMSDLDGSIIVYATAPGDVVEDGTGRNSVFTEHLLEFVDRPGLTLDQVFKWTGKAVAQATNNRQRPWLSMGLYEDIYLADQRPGLQASAVEALESEKVSSPPSSSPAGIPTASSNASQGDVWTDPMLGIEFVWVPGGCYQMGQTEEEKRWLVLDAGQEGYDKYCAGELPHHNICVDGFWMGKYEVTRGQFRKFVNATNYKTDAEKKGEAWIYNKKTGWKWKKKSGYDWRNAGISQEDNHPATNITWNDAKEFINWLQSQTGETFRLPTEAEWEYATRAGSTSKWFWGDDMSIACQYANAADNTGFPGDYNRHWNKRFKCRDGYWGTAPVGTFKPNQFGLYDMSGNVWEWCEDTYDKRAYSKHSHNNPVCSERAIERVIRGGGWSNFPRGVRSAYRYGFKPDDASNDIGFRILRIN